MIFKGTVGKILARDVKTRKGKVTFYSLKLDEHEEWIGLGTRAPTTFEEGDSVAVEAEQNDRGYWEAKGIEIAPARESAGRGQNVGAARAIPAASGGTQPPVGHVATGSGGTDRQAAITLQHSQEMAIRTVALLLEHDGLPLTKASTKAGEAKRFDEIVSAIDKLTVKFHKDVETGRLFETVADMGVVDTSADGPIPDDAGSTSSSEDDL